MKKFSIILFVLAITLSAYPAKLKQIGSINMISTRNVNPSLEYKPIATFAGGSDRELKRSKAKTIDEAIENTIKSVPGGEFLMNVKLFVVDGKYFAVQGDVWGDPNNVSIRGYKVGDRVSWKLYGVYQFGRITALKNADKCTVKNETTEKIVDVEYEKLLKAE